MGRRLLGVYTANILDGFFVVTQFLWSFIFLFELTITDMENLSRPLKAT
jgi:hypothetical protein